MKNKTNKGFTLLELLVSLTIITVILFAFFRILNTTTRVNTKNDRDIKALNIAQTEIENLRQQIKTKSPSYSERKLLIYDDSKQGEDKSEEILFDKDNKSKNEYSRILINKNGSKNKYNIKLDIERELIQGNKKYNNSTLIHSSFNDYKYIINKIEVMLEDNYFSKKVTKLNDIQILSSNLNNTGNDGTESDSNEDVDVIHDKTIDHGHHQVIISSEGIFKENLINKVSKGRFIEYNETHLNGRHDLLIPPPDKSEGCIVRDMIDQNNLFKVKDVNFLIEYKKSINNDPNKIMRITVQEDNQKIESYVGNEWNKYTHKTFNAIGIEVENAGVKLINLSINGKLFGDIEKNTIYKFKEDLEEAEITFDGFEFSNQLPHEDADKTKVYIEFAKTND